MQRAKNTMLFINNSSLINKSLEVNLFDDENDDFNEITNNKGNPSILEDIDANNNKPFWDVFGLA